MRAAIVSLVLASVLTGCASDPALRPHAAARARPADDDRDTTPAEAGRSTAPASTGAEGAAPADGRTFSPAPETAAGAAPGSSAPRAATAGWFMPLGEMREETVISRLGDPRDGGRRSHEGLDIAAPRGTLVLAPLSGTVVVSGTRSLGGNVVVLVDSTYAYELVFSHLHERAVVRGQRVAAGAVIGTVGNTGNAAGGPTHLHLEVRRHGEVVDPYALLLGPTTPTRGQ